LQGLVGTTRSSKYRLRKLQPWQIGATQAHAGTAGLAPCALDYGLFGVVDAETNCIVNEPLAGQYSHAWTLDAVEEYFR
jgi:hypothetical protein